MVAGCGVGGVGTKPKPLLSIEVSSLVRVQEDRVTQWSFFYLIWSFFVLIIMIVPTKSNNKNDYVSTNHH